MIKKSIAWLLTLALCMSIFAGCGNKDVATDVPVDNTVTDDSVTTTDDIDSDTLIITTAGNVTPEAGVKNVVIEADGVILENATLDSVTISPKLGDGTATLNNVNAKVLNANGGGEHSVYVNGGKYGKVNVDRKEGKLHIVISDGTTIKEFTVDSEVLADIKGNIEKILLDNGATGSEVNILEGSKVKELLLKALAQLSIDSEVDSVSVTEGAEGSEIEITKNGKVEKLKTDVPVDANGEGAINELVTNDPKNLGGSVKPDATTVNPNPLGNDGAKPTPTKTPADGNTNPGKKPTPSATPTANPTPTQTPTDPVNPSKPVDPPQPVDKLDVTGVTYKDTTHINVTFDETVEETSATTLTNYIIGGTNSSAKGNPTAVALDSTKKIATLTVATLSAEAMTTTVSVTVSGVKAAADASKVIGVNSGSFTVAGNSVALSSNVLNIANSNATTGTIKAGTMAIVSGTTTFGDIAKVLTKPSSAVLTYADSTNTAKTATDTVADNGKIIVTNNGNEGTYTITCGATQSKVLFGFTAPATDVLNVTFGDKVADVKAEADGSNKTQLASVAYTSSNTAVATVGASDGAVALVGKGTAIITATPTCNAGYYANAETITINVAPQNLKDAKAATLTYNGTAQTPTYTVNGVTTNGIDASNYTVNAPAIKNVGTYSAEITGIGNYQGTVTATVTVDKAILTAVPKIADKVYDGSKDATVSSLSFLNLQNGETLAENTDYTVSGARFIDANVGTGIMVEGQVTLKVTDKTKNYQLKTSGQFDGITGNITQATPTSDVTNKVTEDGATVPYDANGIDLAQFFITNSDGARSYTVTGLAGAAGSNTVSTDKLVVTACGDFTIKMTTAAGKNYKADATGKEFTLTVTKTAGGIAPTGFTAKHATSKGNDGAITGLTGTTTYEYKYTGETGYTSKAAVSGELTGMKAGTLVIRTAATGTQEASADSAAMEIKTLSNSTVITPKGDSFKVTAKAGQTDANITANTVGIEVGTTTVSTITAGLNVPTGTVGIGQMKYTSSTESCTAATFENMPEKKETAKYADGDLIWVLSEDGTAVEKYTITAGEAKARATIEFKNPTIAATFGDTNIATNVATKTADMVDAYKPNIAYASDTAAVATVNLATGAVTIVGAGTATITATATQNGYANAVASYTLTVNPKTIAPNGLTVKSIISLIYDGSAQTPTVTFNDSTTELAATDIDTVTYANNTDVGNVNATVTLQGNYTSVNPIAVANVATIGKKTITAIGATIQPKSYDGNNTATVSDVTFGGLAIGQTLALTTDYTVTATYVNIIVGNAINVTGTVTLKADGIIAKNYTFASGSNTAQLERLMGTITMGKAGFAENVKSNAVNNTNGQTVDGDKLTTDLQEGLTFTLTTGAGTESSPYLCTAAGTSKYVTGFTAFNSTVEAEQAGNYVAYIITAPGGVNASNAIFGLEQKDGQYKTVTTKALDVVTRLENFANKGYKCKVKVDVDGSGTAYTEQFYEIDFSGVIKAPAPNAPLVSGAVTVTSSTPSNYAIDNVLTAAATIDKGGYKGNDTSTYHWYKADNADGTGKISLGEASTAKTFTLPTAAVGKYIICEVTPKTDDGGVGTPVSSTGVGPVTKKANTNPPTFINGTPAKATDFNVSSMACPNTTPDKTYMSFVFYDSPAYLPAELEFITAENLQAATAAASTAWITVNGSTSNDNVAATAGHSIFVRAKETLDTAASEIVEATGKKVVLKKVNTDIAPMVISGLKAPVTAEAPDTAAPVTGVSLDCTASAITWSGNPTNFLADTVYTATFTLTANQDKHLVLANAVTSVNGFTTAAGGNGAKIVVTETEKLPSENVLTVVVTFPATVKLSPVAPAVPTVASRTAISATLNAVTPANPLQVIEYARSGNGGTSVVASTWQNTLVFSDLTNKGTYCFFARVKGDDNNIASLPSKSEIVTLADPIG